jgi:hypothetical protein
MYFCLYLSQLYFLRKERGLWTAIQNYRVKLCSQVLMRVKTTYQTQSCFVISQRKKHSMLQFWLRLIILIRFTIKTCGVICIRFWSISIDFIQDKIDFIFPDQFYLIWSTWVSMQSYFIYIPQEQLKDALSNGAIFGTALWVWSVGEN